MRTHWLWIVAAAGAAGVGCRPSDVLTVPPPAGVIASSAAASLAGAESAYLVAKADLFRYIGGQFFFGLLTWSEFVTDEFAFAGFSGYGPYANIDARITTQTGGFTESGDQPLQGIMTSRASLLLTIPQLEQYEPTAGQSKVGEAFALVGYAEVFVAEDYCAGATLDLVIPGGGIHFGTPTTTDSLLAVAASHFDSALAHAGGDPAIQSLASVGLARARVNRGQFAAASAALSDVPPDFVYNIVLEPGSYSTGGAPDAFSVYDDAYYNGYTIFNVADGEGENGLNFRSALDPRLLFDSSSTTFDGARFYLPEKFLANIADVPLATGIEAALIQAEGALQGGDPVTWLNDLNALRTAGPAISGVDTTWLGGHWRCRGSCSARGSRSRHGAHESAVPRTGLLALWNGHPPWRPQTVGPPIRTRPERGLSDGSVPIRSQCKPSNAPSQLWVGCQPDPADTGERIHRPESELQRVLDIASDGLARRWMAAARTDCE